MDSQDLVPTLCLRSEVRHHADAAVSNWAGDDIGPPAIVDCVDLDFSDSHVLESET